MLIEMFLNELALVPMAVDVATGQQRMEQFVLTMRAATTQGVRRTLHLPENLYQTPLAPGYCLGDWIRDGRVDIELLRFYKLLATKSPFLQDDTNLAETWAAMDCLWQNTSALGLKAAYVADGLSISLLSNSAWDCPNVQCEIQEIAGEEVTCHNELIHNAATFTHVATQIPWIQQRTQDSIDDGRDLWAHVREIFPNLIFCESVESEMKNLPQISLNSIIRGLSKLNAFCVKWQSGPFDKNMIGGSVDPESQRTLQQFSSEHTFLCPDGQNRLFSFHIRTGTWRIYFNYELGPGRLLIGHVGKHLRTVLFPK